MVISDLVQRHLGVRIIKLRNASESSLGKWALTEVY